MRTIRSSKPIVVILVLITEIFHRNDSKSLTGTESRDLSRLFKDNGWLRTTLVSSQSDRNKQLTFNLWKEMSTFGIMSKLVSTGEEQKTCASNRCVFFIFKNYYEEKVNNILASVSNTPARTSVLVVEDFSSVEKVLTKTKINLHFFLATFQDETMILRSVINTKHFKQPVVSNLPSSGVIPEYYDLGGESVKSISMNFPPYLFLEPTVDVSSSSRLPAKASGLCAAAAQNVATQFNFSLMHYLETEGSWGLEPVDGGFDMNGTFEGVIGGVFTGDFDLSIGIWVWNVMRQNILDMAPLMSNSMVLALTPQSPRVDMSFFLRPFTGPSWLVITIITVLIFFMVVPPYLLVPAYENAESHLIASTTGWIFFTLVNAYYSGALTMFFTSDFTMPFAVSCLTTTKSSS